MNTNLTYNDLPTAEREVAHLYAWGLTVKEIAVKRSKSVSTVKNQLFNVFAKADIHKDTELTAWYFCTRFKISLDYSPIHRAITSICLLMLLALGSVNNDNPFVRVRTVNAGASRTVRARTGRGRKNESDYEYE